MSKVESSASRRTNAAISADTRARLIAAARLAFADRGFQATAGEDVVAEAGVTRGALYYQFGDMAGLFDAVAGTVAEELVAELSEATMLALPAHVAGVHDLDELAVGADLLLQAFARGDAAQLLLREAPVVLGHARWTALIEGAGLLGLIDHALDHWIDAGVFPPERKAATAQLIFGALMQAGLAIVSAHDREPTLALYRAAMGDLIRGLMRR